MKRFLVLTALLLLACVLSPLAEARTKVQFDVTDGPTSVISNLFGTRLPVLKSCPGATVQMRVSGTPTNLYDSVGNLLGTSVTAATNGRVNFYIDDGTYDVYMTGGGCSTHTWSGVVIGTGTEPNGVLRVQDYANRGDGAVAIRTGTGTLSMTNGSPTVNGVGTTFLTDLAVGDILKVAGTDSLYVRSISSDTLLTLSRNYAGSTASGLAWTYRMPYTGWEDVKPSTSATCSYQSYEFGYGDFATSVFSLSGCAQIHVYGTGSGSSRIIGTSTSNVIELNTGAPTGNDFGVVVEHLWIKSIGQALNGLDLESVHHSTFNDLKITDVTNAAIYQEFGVANLFSGIRITGNEADQFVSPAYGMYFTRRGVSEGSTTATIVGSHIDQTTTAGVEFVYMGGAHFENTVVEGNTGKGVVMGANSHKTTSNGLHLEANTGTDLEVGGYSHRLDGIFCDGTVTWTAHYGSLSGEINVVNISGNFNSYDILYSLNAGSFTDSGLGNHGHKGPASSFGTAVDPYREHGSSIFRTDNGNDAASFDPGYQEIGYVRYNLIGTTPQNLSSTAFTAGKPWRVLFTGYFSDVSIGPTLAMQPFVREVTSANPSFVVGNRTLTVSQTGGGIMQIAADAIYAGFAGSVHIAVGKYATGLSAVSIATPGVVNSGGAQWNTVLFAALGTPSNGTVYYCSDCTKATPCGSGGTGAIAKRLNSAWDCD